MKNCCADCVFAIASMVGCLFCAIVPLAFVVVSDLQQYLDEECHHERTCLIRRLEDAGKRRCSYTPACHDDTCHTVRSKYSCFRVVREQRNTAQRNVLPFLRRSRGDRLPMRSIRVWEQQKENLWIQTEIEIERHSELFLSSRQNGICLWWHRWHDLGLRISTRVCGIILVVVAKIVQTEFRTEHAEQYRRDCDKAASDLPQFRIKRVRIKRDPPVLLLSHIPPD